MERNVPRLLLIHLVFFVLSVSTVSKVIVIPNMRTWRYAQTYCRQTYTDLITIRDQQGITELAPYGGWIGLRSTTGGWRWSRDDEKLSVSNWESGVPNWGGRCVWKSGSRQGWQTEGCYEPHHFICEDKVSLSPQQMTWEEALSYCRATNNDLVSLQTEKSFLLNRDTIKQKVSTNEVWVGLRFLAGEWWWLDGELARNADLPLCPAQQQHCGVLLSDTGRWKAMDCSEKRHFLCGNKK